MKRSGFRETHPTGFSIENFKRRRALPPQGDAKFFDRILSVRKISELVFISKSAAKNR
jgi:hypothetical protein